MLLDTAESFRIHMIYSKMDSCAKCVPNSFVEDSLNDSNECHKQYLETIVFAFFPSPPFHLEN
jgi:hypothetical protein